MSSRALALIAAASLAPAAAALGALTPDHRLRPGIGAGGVRLGMTEGQVLRVLGAPDTRVEHDGVILISWPGITAHVLAGPGGRVIEVAVTDRGIRTAEGIGVGSTVAQVKATVRDPECEPDRIIRMADDALPGDRVTTFRLASNRTVTAVAVGRITN